MAISTINQNGLNAPLSLTSPVLTTPNLGTPSALVLTNATGTPAAINLTNATALPSAALPTGSVRQVVQTSWTPWTTLGSTTLTATGLTATITPTSNTSKILVFVYANGLYNESSTNAIKFELYRNGGSIAYMDDELSYNVVNYGGSASYSYLDSPTSVSSLTYTMYWHGANGNTIGINNYGSGNNRTRSSVILMEVTA